MTPRARLVCPALRWRRGSFKSERTKIEQALAAGVGGFILFGGTRAAVTALTSALRDTAARPLLLASDFERGPGQQVRGLTELPPPAALGYLNDVDATYACGQITGVEARAVGLNWIFAPVCDLDIEPKNPIVQTRSFGADPTLVGSHAAAWIKGCQEHGVMACAKHYPGHGRTTTDSHEGLPIVEALGADLQDTDVAPFKAAPEGSAAATAIAAGCDMLLYPTDWAGVVKSLETVPADRAETALARYEQAVGRWGDPGAWPRGRASLDDVELGEHQKFADQLADRAVHLVRGERPQLVKRLGITIVDDDVGGPYTIPPRTVFAKTLAESGRHTTRYQMADSRERIVLVYAEPRSWKGRADLGPQSLARLERLVPSASLVVLFAHPRLVGQIPGDVPVLCAWHGQALMQRAAARWVVA
jgi:beta-glucosidase-like glycosyl hydrolase